MVRYSRLLDIVAERAASLPEAPAFFSLPTRESQPEPLSWSALYAAIQAVGARLRHTCSPGARVILLFPEGPQYLIGLFGCLAAGVTAVSGIPPRLPREGPMGDRHARRLSRFTAIVENAGATVALGPAGLLADFRRALGDLEGPHNELTWLSMEGCAAAPPEGCTPLTGCASDPAVIQYTSGSTGAPRGVMLTEAAILHNLDLQSRRYGYAPDDLGVSWLPFFHDMGLIGAGLAPLYAGFPCLYMTPSQFSENPLRWLEVMAAFKATVSWAPNFAYDLCAHHRGRMEADLDLTHWRLAFNSAEPVRVATLRAFEAAYGGCGFASRAMQPCYGLAEATLLVAGGEADGGWRAGVFSPETLSGGRILARRALEASVELVSCGRGAADGTLGVVEPDTRRRLSEGEVGEIWIRSPSVAAGYWNNPEATKAVFEAFTSDGEGPWLRTGDLGVARDGELYIAGRLKDVIIVGGVNYYPQDVEAIVERSHPALRAHSAIAFPIETEDGEGMAVVCEIDRRREAEVEAAILALRRDVFDELGLGAAAIGILRVGGAPKTPSGKVQRSLCRAAFEAGELPLIHGWRRAARRTDEPGVAMAAAHDVDAWTRARLAGLGVRMEEIDLNGCWSDLGVSSIDLVGLPEEVARNFGVHMKLAEIFDCASIMEFCDRVQGAISSPSSGRNVVAAPRLAALG